MLWGGRFEQEFDAFSLEFSSSLGDDINLLHQELQCGAAYAEMLHSIGILTKDELQAILGGLEKIAAEWNDKTWIPDAKVFEDVHSAIESRLYELLGKTAGKLRSGRSRNDQVVTSLRLWVKKASADLQMLLHNVQKTFLAKAEPHVNTIIPGYTHTQLAQPVSLAHHLLAYIEMFQRDIKRLDDVIKEADAMPLGAGALAGSTLPIDSNLLKEKLGFASIMQNSLDAVSDRDFVLDFLNACSIGMMHLSRISEELILWSTTEWGFAKIGDAFTTGSSLMPQKKNPDIAELIRGKANRVFANYQAVASLMKGLLLSYNRDMQEDKPPVFNSYSIYSSSLHIMSEMFKTVEFNNVVVLERMKQTPMLATDAADWLVQQGVPFREAHDIIGELVKYSANNNIPFKDLTLDDLKQVSPAFNEGVLPVLQFEKCLEQKKTLGSPNPNFVRARIAYWKNLLK
jgi:argininosuccinate lyase